MPLEEQQAVYASLQAAWDAYNALADEQKAQVTGAEAFDSLFAVFNAMVNTLQEPEMPPVTYLTYTWVEGERKKESEIARRYTKITSNIDANWESGTYVAPLGDVVIYDRVTVSGDVKLILMDGCNLTCLQGIDVSASDSVTNTLSIYAQSENENIGKLLARGEGENAGIGGGDGPGGTITIYDGTVEAKGGPKSAGIGSGTEANGQSGGAITIHDSTVMARGGDGGAGIGGSAGDNIEHDGGNITIRGGTVTASGIEEGVSHGAGIGGGMNGSGGEIIISGGAVTATAGDAWGVGIGGGIGGTIAITGGTLVNKGAIINNGEIIIAGKGTIQNEGGAITNNNTLTNYGTIHNNGTINSTTGTIFDHRTIDGSDTVTGKVMDTASSVTVAVNNKDGSTATEATYGDNISITATAKENPTAGNSLLRARAAVGSVDFYLDALGGTLLGSAAVTESGGTLTATLTVNDDLWKTIGVGEEKTITADFGGYVGQGADGKGLLLNTGSTTFTVNPINIANATVTLSGIDGLIYNGHEHTPPRHGGCAERENLDGRHRLHRQLSKQRQCGFGHRDSDRHRQGQLQRDGKQILHHQAHADNHHSQTPDDCLWPAYRNRDRAGGGVPSSDQRNTDRHHPDRQHHRCDRQRHDHPQRGHPFQHGEQLHHYLSARDTDHHSALPRWRHRGFFRQQRQFRQPGCGGVRLLAGRWRED